MLRRSATWKRAIWSYHYARKPDSAACALQAYLSWMQRQPEPCAQIFSRPLERNVQRLPVCMYRYKIINVAPVAAIIV